MSDSIMAKWANALVGYSVKVKPRDRVVITGQVAAEPLMRAVYKEVVRVGAFPIVLPTFSGISVDLLKHGNDDQLSYISPIDWFARAEADVAITIMADSNTKSLASVDPKRQQFFQAARRELFKTYMDRSASGDLEWTLTLFPTDAYAQDAGLSTDEFAAFVYESC